MQHGAIVGALNRPGYTALHLEDLDSIPGTATALPIADARANHRLSASDNTAPELDAYNGV